MISIRLALGIGIVSAVVACGTSDEIAALGERASCQNVRETGDIDMRGHGVVGVCEDLPEGGAALLLTFRSNDARDAFFQEVWPGTEFCGSSVLVGDDWAIGIDDGIEKTAALQSRVGGVALPADTGFNGCD